MNILKSRTRSEITVALPEQLQEYLSSAGHKAGRGKLKLSPETRLGGDTSRFKPQLSGQTNLLVFLSIPRSLAQLSAALRSFPAFPESHFTQFM